MPSLMCLPSLVLLITLVLVLHFAKVWHARTWSHVWHAHVVLTTHAAHAHRWPHERRSSTHLRNNARCLSWWEVSPKVLSTRLHRWSHTRSHTTGGRHLWLHTTGHS